jgi:purine-binding chemotaxis protein CheW
VATKGHGGRERIGNLASEVESIKRALFAPADRPTLRLPMQAVVLRVHDFLIAVQVAQVEEIIPMVWVSPLPRAPSAVRGTVNYRGHLLSVVDLEDALTRNPANLGPDELLAVVHTEERRFALAVTGVEDVWRFTEKQLEPPASVATLPSFVLGLFRMELGPVMLVNPDGLLAAGELDLLDELLSAVRDPPGADAPGGQEGETGE